MLIGIIQLSDKLLRGIIGLVKAGRTGRPSSCRSDCTADGVYCRPAGFGPRDRTLAWGRTMGAKPCYLSRRADGADVLWLDGNWVLLTGWPSDAEMDKVRTIKKANR